MKIFMVVYSLQANGGGGVNRAVLNRSKDLVDKGYDVSILTLNDVNIQNIKEKLIKSDRLDARVKLLNIYEDYRLKADNDLITRKVKKDYEQNSKIDESKYKCKMKKDGKIASYFYKGNLIKEKMWRKNNTLEHVDIFNNSHQKELRKVYHKEGFLYKKIYYNSKTGEQKKIKYFTKSGFCFLDTNISNNAKNNEYYHYFLSNKFTSINLLNKFKKRNTEYFKDRDQFFSNWLKSLALEQSSKPIMIFDKYKRIPSMIKMEQNIAYKIFAIHSNHVNVQKEKNFLKTEHKLLLNNLDIVDGVVVLTEEQKADILEYYMDYKNITVIPHHVQNTYNKEIDKDLNKFALVARLSPTKQILQAIEAFKIVVQKVPSAKLNIYGTGPLKNELKNKIKEFKLEDHVFLKGYSDNTDSVYQSSLASILTSRSEAFSMVVLESMSNSTPVISYDINYGPSDIITNGIDGFLIEEDMQALAEKIIYLLNNPDKAIKMGVKAKENVENTFNKKTVMTQWENFLNGLATNSKK